jgi:hypothetical protein
MTEITDAEKYDQAYDAMQDEVADWSDAVFTRADENNILIHLECEMAEVEESLAPDEMADCLLLLFHFARKRGFRMLEAVQGASTGPSSNLVWEQLHGMREALASLIVTHSPEDAGLFAHWLGQLASGKHYSLLDASREKFTDIQGRVWSEPDERGFVHHVAKSEREVARGLEAQCS